MNNKNYIDNDLDNDFEQLLDDFISENLNNNDNDAVECSDTENCDDETDSKPQHPVVTACQISRPDDSHRPTKGDLSVRIELADQFSDIENLRIICLNSNLLEMGLSDASVMRVDNLSIAAEMKSFYCWMPDSYSIVVMHYNEPLMCFRFSYDGSEFTQTSKKALSIDDDEYILLKYIAEENGTASHTLSLAVGMNRGRKLAIDHYKQYILSKWRYEVDLMWLPSYNNFMIISDADNDTDFRFGIPFRHTVNPRLSSELVNCADLTEQRNSVDPYEKATETFDSRSNVVLLLSHISSLFSGGGNTVAKKLLKFLSRNDDCSVIIMCTRSEYEQLRDTYPAICAFFPDENKVFSEKPQLTELVHFVEDYIARKKILISDDAQVKLVEMIEQAMLCGQLATKPCEKLIRMVNKDIIPNFDKRMYSLADFDNTTLSDEERRRQSTIEAIDLEGVVIGDSVPSFEKSMAALNSLIGLQELKQHMASEFNRQRFNLVRRQMGLRTISDTTYHMVFTGNPGTGKTTVAREIGKIYHSLGILSKGEVIMSERSKLVGAYIGETENNTLEAIKQAKGNVLFIDEAYTLFHRSNDGKDYGLRVIETLLTALSQPSPDMVVIFAGYDEEMQQMLQSNPGLIGRFPTKFHFSDFSADELVQIAISRLTEQNFVLTPDAHSLMCRHFADIVAHKDRLFSNARWAKNFVDKGIVPAISDRFAISIGKCSENWRNNISTDDLRQVTADDLRSAIATYSTARTASMQQTIGFRLHSA